MFKLFKKPATDQVMIAEPQVNLKGKTTNEVVEEIHDTFNTEVDKLLASANIANSLDTDKQDLIDKCARLKALGFTSTKEVKDAEAEIMRLNELRQDNEAKKTLIEAINYFSFKYPNYKFITEKSVEKICAKYNLVYCEIDRYIGTVPDKNLKHIEDFKVSENDECYFYQKIHFSMFDGRERREEIKYMEKKKFYPEKRGETHYGRVNTGKCPLEIVGPIKDFDMEGAELKGYKISKIDVPDPIVLKPVIFNNEKHYLIVTAWGIEAGDDLVVNPNHN